MGKRKKSSRGPTKKSKEALPTTFQCLFCNHEKSVAVKMDKKAGVGHIHCKVCGQDWNCGINFLSAPVDVYAEWVDACDEAAKQAGVSGDHGRDQFREPAASTKKVRGPQDAGEEMDGFIENDEIDGEAGYGDE